MTGVNYKNNSISQREKLSFTSLKNIEICKNICNINSVGGCIILSTCNRTEIYISSNKKIDAGKLLLQYSNIADFDGKFEKKEDINVVYHIVELACVIKSQIIGESQIVSQINYSLELSRKYGCTDSFLETLFRTAVTAGKYILTNVELYNIPISSAYAAVDLLSKQYGSLSDKKCIIIGNGKVGKVVQRLLVKNGCNVLVTLRSYKHGNNDVAYGCGAINYNERYNYIDGTDFVISATKSPHYTLTYDKFLLIKKRPEFIIDLAVPRDVEPKISELCRCFNIDELGFEFNIDKDKLDIIYDIIEKFVNNFVQWKNYKLSLDTIASLKDIVYKRIEKSFDINNNGINNYKDIIDFTVGKTVDILLGSMKENISPKILDKCEKKIEERARL